MLLRMAGRLMSPSSSKTVLPCCTKLAARFMESVVLPSPAIALVIRITLGDGTILARVSTERKLRTISLYLDFGLERTSIARLWLANRGRTPIRGSPICSITLAS